MRSGNGRPKWIVVSGTAIMPDSHVWRHTRASHLVKKNANLRQVQDLLGHRSLATTALPAPDHHGSQGSPPEVPPSREGPVSSQVARGRRVESLLTASRSG